jgi:hypothetical protein
MTSRTGHYVAAEAGKAAGIGFPVHPHMLRPWDRLLPGKRRAGHAGDSAIPRSQEYPACRAGSTCVRSSTFLKQRILDTGASRVGVSAKRRGAGQGIFSSGQRRRARNLSVSTPCISISHTLFR